MGDSNENDNYSKSRHMRAILRAERERQKLSAREIADRVSERLREVALKHNDMEALQKVRKHTPQMVYHWEGFGAHPPIDKFAAWAHVLGFALKVELAPPESADKQVVLLRHPEAIEIARMVDSAPQAKREALLATIRALMSS